eukprot:TRINITY_DN3202_c0_g1_i5.p3 TRINITY_DN3202_c0_g1~~TRINITY_DN3202_c0_g1_i5.p3  ORF type:complete len:190 (-),score=7.69 TRINITY_DN3202_c0_g1_i5:579-1148(-)
MVKQLRRVVVLFLNKDRMDPAVTVIVTVIRLSVTLTHKPNVVNGYGIRYQSIHHRKFGADELFPAQLLMKISITIVLLLLQNYLNCNLQRLAKRNEESTIFFFEISRMIVRICMHAYIPITYFNFCYFFQGNLQQIKQIQCSNGKFLINIRNRYLIFKWQKYSIILQFYEALADVFQFFQFVGGIQNKF